MAFCSNELFPPFPQFDNIIEKIFSPMETTLDEFQHITSIFYRKILQIHPKKKQLYEKYRHMLELFNRKKDDRFETLSSRQRKSKLDFDENKSVSNISAKSLTKSYKSIRNIELKSISSDYLFISSKFDRTFLYAYYYELIYSENKKTMEIVETNTKLLIDSVNRKQLNEVNWNKTNLEWKKLKQLLPHKQQVRWEKILGELITTFPDLFIRIMMSGIVLQKHQQLKDKSEEEKIQKLSQILKIRIIYFECQTGEIIKKKTYGQGKSKIRIGYLISDQKYGFFDKLPNESDISQVKEQPPQKHRLTIGQAQFPTSSLRHLDRKSQRTTEIGKSSDRDLTRRNSVLSQNKSQSSRSSLQLGKRKVIRAIENILLDFKNDSLKLQELECMKGENEKQREIKMRLNRRRQNQK